MPKPADSSDTHKPITVVAQSPDAVYFLAKDVNNLVFLFDCEHRVGMPYWQARASGEVWGLATNPMQAAIGVQRFEIRTIKLNSTVRRWLEHRDVEMLVQSIEVKFFDEHAENDPLDYGGPDNELDEDGNDD